MSYSTDTNKINIDKGMMMPPQNLFEFSPIVIVSFALSINQTLIVSRRRKKTSPDANVSFHSVYIDSVEISLSIEVQMELFVHKISYNHMCKCIEFGVTIIVIYYPIICSLSIVCAREQRSVGRFSTPNKISMCFHMTFNISFFVRRLLHYISIS